MLKDCHDLPAVRDMLNKAKDILGYDLEELCLNGPEERLSETEVAQPALFVGSLAALEVMKQTHKDIASQPQAVAGLSIGEYAALCAAGVLEFEDGLRLVNLRAQAMKRASEMSPQALGSVAGLDRELLMSLCKQAKARSGIPEESVCEITNTLFPKGFSVAGAKETVEALIALARSNDALQANIVNSGAFHTRLMKPAQDELEAALAAVLPKMKAPRCSIYFNATGARVPPGTPPHVIARLLKMQMTSEIKWFQSMEQMIRDEATEMYEVGPKKQLKAMMKRIDQDAWSKMINVTI